MSCKRCMDLILKTNDPLMMCSQCSKELNESIQRNIERRKKQQK